MEEQQKKIQEEKNKMDELLIKVTQIESIIKDERNKVVQLQKTVVQIKNIVEKMKEKAANQSNKISLKINNDDISSNGLKIIANMIWFVIKYEVKAHADCWVLNSLSITNDDCKTLSRILKVNSVIKGLKLQNIQIDDSGATIIAEVLNTNSSLKTLELQDNLIGDTGATAIAEGLKNNSTLTSIDMRENHNITEIGSIAIYNALKISKVITTFSNISLSDINETSTKKSVDLDMKKLGNCEAIVIAEYMKINSSFSRLDLSNNEVTNTGATAIAEAFKQNSSIKDLYLDENKITDSGIEAIGEVLNQNETLCFLSMEGNTISKAIQNKLYNICTAENFIEVKRILVKILYTIPNDLVDIIRHYWSDNVSQTVPVNWNVNTNSFKDGSTIIKFCLKQLNDNDAKIIAYLLKVNSSIKKLDLMRNKIGDAGATAIAKSLEVNSSIKTLSLNGNKIGDAGATAIGKLLEINSSVTDLNLAENTIEDKGATAISEALKINTKIEEVILNTKINIKLFRKESVIDGSSKNYKNEDAIIISCFLKINSSLTILYLYNNKIENTGAISLAEALKINSVLITLDLEVNKIQDQGAFCILKALKCNKTLINLCLRRNKINEHCKIELQTMQQKHPSLKNNKWTIV